MTCATCKHFHPHGEGVCRRFPKQVFWNSNRGGSDSAFPHVEEDQWCGEFQAKDAP